MTEIKRNEKLDLLTIKIPKNANVDKLVSFAKFAFEKDQPLQRRLSDKFDSFAAAVSILLSRGEISTRELKLAGLSPNLVRDKAVSIIRSFSVKEADKESVGIVDWKTTGVTHHRRG